MCNCNNRNFQVKNGKLYGEYDGDFHQYDDESYSYCPVCGEDLQPERLNPKTIDSAWIKWDQLIPPEDVKGIFIMFDNDQIWTDAHFRGSDGYRRKTIGNAKPIAWTFIKRRDPNEKSIQC